MSVCQPELAGCPRLPAPLAHCHCPRPRPCLHRHSRLSGSRDLEEWLRAGAEAVQGAWREHVVAPLAGLRNELFNTFR